MRNAAWTVASLLFRCASFLRCSMLYMGLWRALSLPLITGVPAQVLPHAQQELYYRLAFYFLATCSPCVCCSMLYMDSWRALFAWLVPIVFVYFVIPLLLASGRLDNATPCVEYAFCPLIFQPLFCAAACSTWAHGAPSLRGMSRT